jgi:ADP-heptose:LPS heptosyltransferase
MAVNEPLRGQVNSILVYVGLDLVGDGLIKLPFVRALRDTYPHARITWLAGKDKSAFNGVLKNVVAGLIDEVIERTDIGVSWSEVLRNPMPGRAFDLIIDTQKGALASLALRRIRHKAIVSPFANFLLSSRRPPNGYKFPKNLQRQLLDLLEIASGTKHPTPSGLIVPIDPSLRDLAAQLLPAGPIYVGLAPGAGGIQKCWPLEKFIALAKEQHAQGRVPVFILGPAEAGWDFKIRAEVPFARFPLQDNEVGVQNGFAPELTIALANRTAVCVANDSGTGHMCAISGAAMVSLFGRTTPDKFMPMASRVAIVKAQDFGGREMDLIPLDAVTAAIDRMLAD